MDPILLLTPLLATLSRIFAIALVALAAQRAWILVS
jgi:hypothetical protein